MAVRERRLSDVLKRGYSDQELARLYELGRFLLENGDLKRAEPIMLGLVTIAPEFCPAWLGLCYLQVESRHLEEALLSARNALKADPDSVEAALFLIACLILTGDFNAAGSHLGEVGEKISSGAVDGSYIVRFFKMQLARYQARK